MQPIPAVIDGNTASALGIEAHGSTTPAGKLMFQVPFRRA
jgi:hypothetical protein